MTDTTAPTPTFLTLPGTVNVSGSGQAVTLTLGAIDDLSGIFSASITFDKQISYVINGTTYSYRGFGFDTSSDPFSDGQSSVNVTLSPYTPSGTYNVSTVDLVDKSGNSHSYSNAELAARGLPTSFTVSGENQSPAANVAPTITSNGSGDTAAMSVAENSTAVTTVTATDTDVGQNLNYSIGGGADAAKFTIGTSTGTLSFATTPDFEVPTDAGGNNVYDVIVQVTDGAGGLDTQAVAVTVTDQNEAPAFWAINNVTRVSTDANGAQRNGESFNPSISADGRYVAFESFDSNTQSLWDVFLRDLQTGAITRVSSGNYRSYDPSISADGRYVAFISGASNLVPGDTNGAQDVFVRDLQTGAITRISTNANGVQGNNDSQTPSISADGRYVAFISFASNLVPGDSNGSSDVFVRDLLTGEITRVSDANGAQWNGPGVHPSISADGRYVAFLSGTLGQTDVFVRDLQTSAIARVSELGVSFNPSISADGRYVAFEAFDSNLVPGDTNSAYDVFVRDLQTSAITRVSTDSNGVQGNGDSLFPSISADGRYVAFASRASNLVSGDTNGSMDLFVRDLQTGVIIRVSTDGSGEDQGNLYSNVTIAADGRYVMFTSSAFDLVAGDTNGVRDVFVAPSGFAANSALRLWVAENSTAVTAVTATDPDTGQTLSYSISGGADASKFTINADTGVLSFVTAPNFEVPTDAGGNNVYDVTILVSDGHGGTDNQTVAVTMTDVFENTIPTITSNAGGDTAAVSIAENTTAATTVTATDPDAGQALSYSISGGADASKFTINANTGALSFITAPNFEIPTDADRNNAYDVAVQVSDGHGGIDTQGLSVSIQNVPDGNADILWQNNVVGTPAMWHMDGMSPTTGAVLPNPGPAWHVVDAGDFNGDGRSDILWQGSDGTPAVWLMGDTKPVWVGAIGPFNPGPDWQIKGTGDFNGDGRSDILWQGSDGTPAIWMMNGTQPTWLGAVGPFNPGPSWEIKGTGDFNGDGKSDILWQNNDGMPAIWLMDGTNVVSLGVAGPFNPGPSWEIKGSDDFNRDGKSDILWQGSDGTPAVWLMDDLAATNIAALPNLGSDWHIIA